MIPGFVLGSIGLLACIMSHSLANRCHTLGSGRARFTLLCPMTGSAWGSNVVMGTEYLGVGRALSAAASPAVVDHLYWDDRLSPLVASTTFARSRRFLERREVHARSSRLKCCGWGDLTMGFSDARRTVESVYLGQHDTSIVVRRFETFPIIAVRWDDRSKEPATYASTVNTAHAQYSHARKPSSIIILLCHLVGLITIRSTICVQTILMGSAQTADGERRSWAPDHEHRPWA